MMYSNFENKPRGWQIAVRKDCEKILREHDEVFETNFADLLRSKKILDNNSELISFCKKVCEM